MIYFPLQSLNATKTLLSLIDQISQGLRLSLINASQGEIYSEDTIFEHNCYVLRRGVIKTITVEARNIEGILAELIRVCFMFIPRRYELLRSTLSPGTKLARG